MRLSSQTAPPPKPTFNARGFHPLRYPLHIKTRLRRLKKAVGCRPLAPRKVPFSFTLRYAERMLAYSLSLFLLRNRSETQNNKPGKNTCTKKQKASPLLRLHSTFVKKEKGNLLPRHLLSSRSCARTRPSLRSRPGVGGSQQKSI